ncbi:SAM-dependent chlorinase/fluorinase, partial [bacterium]|nr:SAM-dependent chlorinase/fluorinase [bacterium]
MIVLLSDFGLSDAYVAVMKAVILKISPEQKILDLTHSIQPQNIYHANTILLDNYHYFPKRSIFCCVIDPGVGSARKALLVQTHGYSFIGPDNGLFTNLFDEQAMVYLLETTDYLSSTFHGRDLFAPMSAQLAMGYLNLESLETLDPQHCQELEKLKISHEISKRGEVIYSDHFGNLISNIKKESLPSH